jgi:hypothetical protein
MFLMIMKNEKLYKMKIKTKQLLITLNEYPWLKFDARIKNIELYDDEFSFYQEDEEIFIQRDGVLYFVELFFPETTTYEYIFKIGKKCQEKMIEHFQNKISKFEDMIREVKRHEF